MKNIEDINSHRIMIIIILLSFLLAGVDPLFGQNNFEYLQTDSKETSRFRPNLYYELPWSIKGYAYIEIYMNGKNYFGQNYLTKEIKGIFGVQSETNFASFFIPYTGLGPMITIPTKESTLLTFSFMPLFIDFKGKYLSNYVLAEFVFFKEFKLSYLGTWRINSFGQINIASKGGPTWNYGEAYLEKTLGSHLYLGAGADLFCNTKWYPDANWGLKLGYSF